MQVQVALTRELIATFEAILQQRQRVHAMEERFTGLLQPTTTRAAATYNDASDDEDVLMRTSDE